MSRLIDADALIKSIIQMPLGGIVFDCIHEAPTIEERKKGRWLETDAAPHRIYCSECYKTYIPNKEWVAWKEHIVPRNYCPNCGCKMEDKP